MLSLIAEKWHFFQSVALVQPVLEEDGQQGIVRLLCNPSSLHVASLLFLLIS